MERYDAILSPTLAALPPELGSLSLSASNTGFLEHASAASAFTSLFNISGQPAMTLPLHWTQATDTTPELPVGVMFAGRFGDEATLFRLGAQLEGARPWFARKPSLAAG